MLRWLPPSLLAPSTKIPPARFAHLTLSRLKQQPTAPWPWHPTWLWMALCTPCRPVPLHTPRSALHMPCNRRTALPAFCTLRSAAAAAPTPCCTAPTPRIAPVPRTPVPHRLHPVPCALLPLPPPHPAPCCTAPYTSHRTGTLYPHTAPSVPRTLCSAAAAAIAVPHTLLHCSHRTGTSYPCTAPCTLFSAPPPAPCCAAPHHTACVLCTVAAAVTCSSPSLLHQIPHSAAPLFALLQ
ncbi:hypothetical protein B0H10DRAFT_2243712 [Mycena sp. CBHHK59/15]|nr:hypothetical protein B0H10DRAFT_2243712 [Mycena sp. CBHHK59/15]